MTLGLAVKGDDGKVPASVLENDLVKERLGSTQTVTRARKKAVVATASGITLTLWGSAQDGDQCRIINRGGGTIYLAATGGDSIELTYLYDGEGHTFVYDSTDNIWMAP